MEAKTHRKHQKKALRRDSPFHWDPLKKFDLWGERKLKIGNLMKDKKHF
jgi:hypothetical protein